MAKSEKDTMIDNITLLIACIVTVPMALYFGTITVYAFIPALKMIWALIACVGILLGTLFSLFVELGPFMMIFLIPICMMLFAGAGNGRNGRR